MLHRRLSQGYLRVCFLLGNSLRSQLQWCVFNVFPDWSITCGKVLPVKLKRNILGQMGIDELTMLKFLLHINAAKRFEHLPWESTCYVPAKILKPHLCHPWPPLDPLVFLDCLMMQGGSGWPDCWAWNDPDFGWAMCEVQKAMRSVTVTATRKHRVEVEALEVAVVVVAAVVVII